ncbi:MAG: response regulator [Betaproteobacteria bacterium]
MADDDHDTTEMLASILRDEGHVVYTAYSGADVLPAMQLFRPDAVILDVNLPKVSGFALAQAARSALSDVRRPLLIAISGVWTQAPDRLVGQQVGFDHYLVKPTDPNHVLAHLNVLRHATL